MEFALSEEQELLVDSVSKMLVSNCSVDELRSQASGEKTFSDKINNEFLNVKVATRDKILGYFINKKLKTLIEVIDEF